MKNIFKIILSLLVFSFLVNLTYWNADRWGNDRWWNSISSTPTWVTVPYCSNLKIVWNSNANVKYSFDWNCSADSKIKYRNASYIWDYSKINMSNTRWLSVIRWSDWRFNFSNTQRYRSNVSAWNINLISQFNFKKTDFFPGLSNNFWVDLWINEVFKKFNLVLIPNSSVWWSDSSTCNSSLRFDYDLNLNCKVTCKDEYEDVITWKKDEKGNPIIEKKFIWQSTDSKCSSDEVTTNKLDSKPWVILPEFDIKISDTEKKCILKWKVYYCYASDSYDIEYTSKIEWEPGPVNLLKSYILNESWSSCAFQKCSWWNCTPVASSQCPVFDIKINWDWKYNFSSTKFREAWKYTLEFTSIFEKDWKVKNWSQPKTLSIEIVPNLDLKWEIKEKNTVSSWLKYANLKDSYDYILKITDSFGNKVESSRINEIFSDCKWISWCEPLKSLGFDKKLTYKNDILTEKTTIKTRVRRFLFSYKTIVKDVIKKDIYSSLLKIYSLNPQDFSEYFRINIKSWWPDNSLNWKTQDLFVWDASKKKKFHYPASLESILVKSKDASWKEVYNNSFVVWLDQSYKLTLKNIWNLTWLTNWTIDFNEKSFEFDKPWYKFIWLRNKINGFWVNLNSYLWFIAKIDWLLDSVIIWNKKDWIRINYVISTNWFSWFASYFLEKNTAQWCSRDTLWVKIIWNVQSIEKAAKTAWISVYTNLAKAELIKNIKKKTFELIRNIKSWQTLDGVHFVENKDVIISWDLPYETLVVKNWNVIISWDLNKSGKKLWIIVLKDNYNVNKDYNKSWNIYVNNNVSYINAFVYSDWTIRSAKNDWSSYSDAELWNKLEIKWSLFTKNTIWGAISTEVWKYTLPWWSDSLDFNLAQIYDLNFLRKVPPICVNWKDTVPYSLRIEYDSSIQLNWPKWFK